MLFQIVYVYPQQDTLKILPEMPRKFLYLLMKNFGLSPLKVYSSTVLSTTVLSITSMAEFREKPGQISHSYNNSLLVKYQTVQFLLWCLSNRVLQNRSFNFYLQLSISIELKHKINSKTEHRDNPNDIPRHAERIGLLWTNWVSKQNESYRGKIRCSPFKPPDYRYFSHIDNNGPHVKTNASGLFILTLSLMTFVSNYLTIKCLKFWMYIVTYLVLLYCHKASFQLYLVQCWYTKKSDNLV